MSYFFQYPNRILEELDFHDFSVVQSMLSFIAIYNRYSVSKTSGEIKIIHGYGSSGNGGVIRKKIRTFFKSQKLTYICGENIDSNPGYTIVSINQRLPELIPDLVKGIIGYCASPKNKTKIAGKFRRYGWPETNKTIRELLKQGIIQEKQKGKEKVYKTI